MEHQYALDMTGRWINAKQTPYVEGVEFRCDCPDRHRLKLVKPSGRPGKRVFEDYFAHVSIDGHGSCVKALCRGGGESAEHRWAKQALREWAGTYDFVVWRCGLCGNEGVVDSAAATVAIEVRSTDGKWRYDCLLTRPGEPGVALEVYHTHATGLAKSTGVRALGLELAEFETKDVMRLQAGARIRLHNMQVRLVDTCAACQARAEEEQYRLAGPEPLMRIPDMTSRCQALLVHAASKLCLRVPGMGLLRFRRAKRVRGGVAFSGCVPRLPTLHVCALLVGGGPWRGLQRVRSVERAFHVFLDCDEVQRALGASDAGSPVLRDRRVEIIGPEPDPPCFRCGHRGHGAPTCRAVVDVLGQACDNK